MKTGFILAAVLATLMLINLLVLVYRAGVGEGGRAVTARTLREMGFSPRARVLHERAYEILRDLERDSTPESLYQSMHAMILPDGVRARVCQWVADYHEERDTV